MRYAGFPRVQNGRNIVLKERDDYTSLREEVFNVSGAPTPLTGSKTATVQNHVPEACSESKWQLCAAERGLHLSAREEAAISAPGTLHANRT